MQLAALSLVKKEIADREARAIQREFGRKREYLQAALQTLGLKISPQPQGSFYCWADLSGLPGELSNGMSFFEKALEHKVIVVPGEFFDINPGQRRPNRPSRFRNHARVSFGPSYSALTRGVESLSHMIHGA